MVGGFLKSLVTSGSAIVLAIFGSVFFILKAEIATARSSRERDLIVQMIWLRFGFAFLAMAAPILIWVMMPSVYYRPGVVELGFAGFCFCGAVESAARLVYFHHRRRQIQVEEAREIFEPDQPPQLTSLPSNMSGNITKEAQYSRIAAAFGLVGCFIMTATFVTPMINSGHWVVALIFLLWGGFGAFRWIRNHQQIPRFFLNAGFGKILKPVVFFGVLTLLLFNFSWFRGRFPQSNLLAVGFNIAVVLSYLALIAVCARLHRTPAGPRDFPLGSTQKPT